MRTSVESLLKKPDSWKNMRSLDDDDDDEAWFDDEEDELLPGGGESLATPCMIAARLSPDCDQISQYLDKGYCFLSLFLFSVTSAWLCDGLCQNLHSLVMRCYLE